MQKTCCSVFEQYYLSFSKLGTTVLDLRTLEQGTLIFEKHVLQQSLEQELSEAGLCKGNFRDDSGDEDVINVK